MSDEELIPYDMGPDCQLSGEPFRNLIPRRKSQMSEAGADDLTAFIAARLDEDEAAARESYYEGQRWLTEDEGVYRWPDDELVHTADRKADARHIARHDPARVLRDVAADRMLLLTWESQAGYDLPDGVHEGRDPDERAADELIKWELYDVLKIRAAIWSGHPDYRAEWKP